MHCKFPRLTSGKKSFFDTGKYGNLDWSARTYDDYSQCHEIGFFIRYRYKLWKPMVL